MDGAGISSGRLDGPASRRGYDIPAAYAMPAVGAIPVERAMSNGGTGQKRAAHELVSGISRREDGSASSVACAGTSAGGKNSRTCTSVVYALRIPARSRCGEGFARDAGRNCPARDRSGSRYLVLGNQESSPRDSSCLRRSRRARSKSSRRQRIAPNQYSAVDPRRKRETERTDEPREHQPRR